MFEELATQVAEGTASPLDAVAVLAALSDEQVLTMEQDEALAVIELTQAATAALAAVQALAIEAFTRRQAETLQAFKARCRAEGDTTRGIPIAEEVVPAMLAPVLHLSPRTLSTLVGETRILVGELPLTFALARAGRIEMSRARSAASEASLVAPELREEFDKQLVHPDRRYARLPLAGLSAGAFRQRAARTAVRVDPASAAARAELLRQDRFVRTTPGVVAGVTAWAASLPSEESLLAWAAIDALAAEYVEADPTRSVEAARADAMTDLILERATITTTIDLVVPAPFVGVWSGDSNLLTDATGTANGDPVPTDAFAGSAFDSSSTSVASDDRASRGSLAEVVYLSHLRARHELDLRHGGQDGHLHRRRRQQTEVPPTSAPPTSSPPANAPPSLPITGAPTASPAARPAPTDCQVGVAQHRVGIILNSVVTAWLADPDTRIRLHEADPVTGTLLRHDPTIYRPGAALARAVRARDGHCRFPGCTTTAARCQLDHVTRFPDGPTTLHNLNALCRKHHMFKHHAGWTLTMTPDGTCTWASPLGRTYTTKPTTTHDLAA
ncbi:MAG: HNH endonuclease signature motif containing protein [Lapillicoccus sp.]